MEIRRTRLKYLLTALVLSLFTLAVLLHATGISHGYLNQPTRNGGKYSYMNYHSFESNSFRLNRTKWFCDQTGPHSSLNLSKRKLFRGIYVDDTYHLLYCEVPKVACTNWKRIFIMLSGKVNTSDPMSLPSKYVHGHMSKLLRTLDTYSSSEIRHRIEHYFKFMFVRDPLERLLSAYRNKFTLRYNQYFKDRYGKQIIQKYRKNATEDALTRGHDVKFHEFIKYVLDPDTQRKVPFNTHWRPYYQLCHPCIMDYDVIGKYETLNRDTHYVLKRAGLNGVVNFPKAPTLSIGKTEEVMSRFYSDISAEEIHQLWELYAVDYNMFGYKYPQIRHR